MKRFILVMAIILTACSVAAPAASTPDPRLDQVISLAQTQQALIGTLTAPTLTPIPQVALTFTPTNSQAPVPTTTLGSVDEDVFIPFGGKLRNVSDSNSGYEGIWAVHKSWLQQEGGYGLQGNLVALLCGNNGLNIPADAQCLKDVDTFIDTWKPAEGKKHEFMNDGSWQFAKYGDRLFIFSWDLSVQPNQISNIFWTGNSFVICKNDTGPEGKFGGSDVGPCIEVDDWIPWSDAGSLPDFAPYLEEYNKLISIPTSAELLAHGNPMLLVTFTKPKP